MSLYQLLPIDSTTSSLISMYVLFICSTFICIDSIWSGPCLPYHMFFFLSFFFFLTLMLVRILLLCLGIPRYRKFFIFLNFMTVRILLMRVQGIYFCMRVSKEKTSITKVLTIKRHNWQGVGGGRSWLITQKKECL